MAGTLHIDSDDSSVYGYIKHGNNKHDFQLVYGNDCQYIKLDQRTPDYLKWLNLLTDMVIVSKLI